MTLFKRFFFTLLMVGTGCLSGFSVAKSSNALLPTATGNLSKAQIDTIIDRFAGRPFDDFQDFAFGVYNSGQAFLSRDQSNALAKFVVKEPLSGSEREMMFRVLGLYSQLKYGGDALRSLKTLIEAPVVEESVEGKIKEGHAESAGNAVRARSKVGVRKAQSKYVRTKHVKTRHVKTKANTAKIQRKNRALVSANARLLKQMAKEFGLRFRAVNDTRFEITTSRKLDNATVIELHTHLGVAKTGSRDWIVDGVQLNPFTLTRIHSNLYGRGVQDNKNALIVVMYAMRIMIEENITLLNNIKLIVDASGHVQGHDLKPVLVEKQQKPLQNAVATPTYRVVLDGHYPVEMAHPTAEPADSQSKVDLAFGTARADQDYTTRWGQALLVVASESLDASAVRPVSKQAASKSDKTNTLRFGLSRPSDKGANRLGLEYKTVDQFLLDLQVVTELVARVGQMRELD